MFHVFLQFAPLFRAVFDAPNDLSRREVLADALLERGEVRGEFIALQLDDSTRARKRATKLLVRHRWEFLGGLAESVMHETDEWRNGFLYSAHARLDGRAANEPSWATVEYLVGHIGRRVPRELASTHLKSLRRLTVACEWQRGENATWAQSQAVLKVVREQLIEGRRPRVLPEGGEWAS